jgi:hypothetical protein
MDIFFGTERLMAMNDETLERHANPLSVYSRSSCLPLIVAAIWSRVWLGWWAAVPLALAIGWTFLNPRLFSAPIDKGTSAAKAVMGERLFLVRKTSAVPQRHVSMAHWLTALSLAGAVVIAYGVIMLDARATLAGLAVAMTDKLWFCDRMVWLYGRARGLCHQFSLSTASRKASIRPSGALMTCCGAGKLPPRTSATYSLKAAIRSSWIACIIL